MKEIKVILSPEAEEIFKYLQKTDSKIEKSILAAIKRKTELIKANPHYGNPISKRLIPKNYKEQYGITNLFRVELPNFWRMLYSLVDGETKIEIIAFILDISDHRTYNKRFGYR
ncbi:hypothetical protein GOV09_00050 [Candidatus Woesearchaeota archaeon]|nr:hypothetical protein [Candidatus Woesearchaeota archaeon]